MCVLNKNDVYDDFISSTDCENDKIDIILSILHLSIPDGVIILYLLSFLIWTMIKPSLAD